MVVDPAVAEYLRLMREGGHTPEQAREKLLEAGWDSAAVDGAFDQPQPSKRFQALFFHPDEFFARVQGVTSHSALLKDLALFGAVAGAAGALTSLPQLGPDYPPAALLFAVPFTAVLMVGVFILGAYAAAGLYHVGIRLFGGKGGYFATFKAAVYTLVVSLAYQTISAISLFLLSFLEPQARASLFELQQLSLQSHPLTVVVSSVLTLASMVHSLSVLSTGISQYHQMGRFRALLGALLLPLVLAVVFGALVMGALLAGLSAL